jgi:malonate-semialdehyde dehydrogenase (acetylating)/methylmalonate-semialdehyde dehydrogenase
MTLAHIGHYIAGAQFAGTTGRTQDVYNPATGEVTGKVALADAGEVGKAVAAAQAAFPAWSNMPPIRRARLMNNFLGLLNKNKDSRWSTARSSPTPRAKSSVASTSSNSPAVSRSCSRATTPNRSPPASTTGLLRQPLGVVAGITPFNFPVMVPMWMFPVAIACGNTFVLKPSETDPSASCSWPIC